MPCRERLPAFLGRSWGAAGSIKIWGEPGEALHRVPLDAGDVPRPSTCRRCARTVAGGAIGRDALDCRHGGERRQHQGGEPGEALHRAPLDAGGVPRPSTCRDAAPGPMPRGRDVSTFFNLTIWRFGWR
jgi:hypothetical protein